MDECPRPCLEQTQLTAIENACLKTNDPVLIRISKFLAGILQPEFEVVDLRLCQFGAEQNNRYSVFLKYRTPGYFHSTYTFLPVGFQIVHDPRKPSLKESIQREREAVIASRRLS